MCVAFNNDAVSEIPIETHESVCQHGSNCFSSHTSCYLCHNIDICVLFVVMFVSALIGFDRDVCLLSSVVIIVRFGFLSHV